jgi:DNA-binding NtrC family response regulator
MSAKPAVLVVDDDRGLRVILAELLREESFDVHEAEDGARAVEIVEREPIDLVLLDLRLPDTTGLDLLPRLRELRPEASVVMLTAQGSIRDAVEAMRLGADNFVAKPIEPEALSTIARKGIEAAALRRRASRSRQMASSSASPLLGESPEMESALRAAQTIAPRETTVLILGPTGSGKGLLARRIHDLSPRRGEPFVALNAAGLARDLTESELFGHERGAFTGAVEKKLGLLEIADGGTLFLDEIGEMDPGVQAKLLTVMEEKRLRRVGGTAEQRCDVRFIAATHRDLRAEIAAGRFREDLYFRLNVFAISLPPLADRPEDILPLALHFLSVFRRNADPASALAPETASLLIDYPWPGNVRELRNVMERAAIVAPPGSPILPRHLPPLEASSGGLIAPIAEAERRVLEQALRRSGGSVADAAGELGVSRATLYRKLKKLGITP